MANDPFKYFRAEARELVDGLTQGVLDLEKGKGDAGTFARILRYAHTLKGAARVVKQTRIADLSHSMEETLIEWRDNPRGISGESIRTVLGWIDNISAELAALNKPIAAETTEPAQDKQESAPEMGDEQLETIRIDMKDMDALLRTILELRVQVSGLTRKMNDLQHAAKMLNTVRERPSSPTPAGAVETEATTIEQLESMLKEMQRTSSAILERSERETKTLYEQATAMRLMPSTSIFGMLERTARDAAEATGKQISFRATGGEVRMDAHGLRILRDALVHLVRNAVVHGVELPAKRAAAGKPAMGNVRLEVQRRGDQAVFICSDDGGGIDVNRVRQVVRERKWVSDSEADQLNPTAAAALLLRGGITTTRSVSQLAGRGIGLDAVRQAVSSLNGSISAETRIGEGTRIELSVPVLVESQEVLHLRSEASLLSVPRQGVKQIIRIAAADIAHSPEGLSVLHDGQVLRYAPLSLLMGIPAGQPASAQSILILQSGSMAAAVGVDHVLAVESVVIRALPEILGTVDLVSGAFLDSEGNPQLVLNIDGIINRVSSGSAESFEKAVKSTPPLLVIDDSLTTRMLEQGILEAAGYEVDTASSGEEALEKARQRRYGVFIVDVEMPGMDGFTFVETARSEPQLHAIPAIIVTSRDSAEDRARGDRAGAKAYIVKSKFDEEMLLRTIQELVG